MIKARGLEDSLGDSNGMNKRKDYGESHLSPGQCEKFPLNWGPG